METKTLPINEFKLNRRRFDHLLDEHTAVLLTFEDAGPDVFRFYTGIDDQNAVLVCYRNDEGIQEMLFLEGRSTLKSRWEGRIKAEAEIKQDSQIEEVESMDKFFTFFYKKVLGLGIDRIYGLFAGTQEKNLASAISKRWPFVTFLNLTPIAASHFLVKTEAEINNIRAAIALTGKALKAMVDVLTPGMSEVELVTYYDQVITKARARNAFSPIIASGSNATCLHAPLAERIIQSGDLILFDIGAQVNGFCADISRTIPVDLTFTEEQAKLYQIVLDVQNELITLFRPGVKIDTIQTHHEKILAEKLVANGIFADNLKTSEIVWHNFGHSLGRAAHDLQWGNVELAPGMVFTVEPGVYLEERGIGIRIEDDILITADGAEVLSVALPRTIEEILKWRKS